MTKNAISCLAGMLCIPLGDAKVSILGQRLGRKAFSACKNQHEGGRLRAGRASAGANHGQLIKKGQQVEMRGKGDFPCTCDHEKP